VTRRAPFADDWRALKGEYASRLTRGSTRRASSIGQRVRSDSGIEYRYRTAADKQSSAGSRAAVSSGAPTSSVSTIAAIAAIPAVSAVAIRTPGAAIVFRSVSCPVKDSKEPRARFKAGTSGISETASSACAASTSRPAVRGVAADRHSTNLDRSAPDIKPAARRRSAIASDSAIAR
jgi:hypothetical protein